MKVLHTKALKDGRRHLLIELRPEEEAGFMHIPGNSFFQLGYPLEQTIIESHHLRDLQRVAWDAYSQKWVEA